MTIPVFEDLSLPVALFCGVCPSMRSMFLYRC
jgi:hypothetical protein